MANYLRNRPFLLVEFSYVAGPNVNTSEKGWSQKDGALKAMQKVTIVDRVSSKQEVRSRIIIDIIDSKMVKNSSGVADETVMAEYLSQYKDEVVEALGIWAQKELTTREAAGETE